MYERFTDRARKVMQLANQEAQRFNHEYVGTEHVLLGLVKEGSGVAANVLKNLDVDLRKIRNEVEKIVQAGPDMVTMGKLPQTPRAKKVIEYAIEEARNLNHNYVGTEHLLLGLLREQEGVAAQVLVALNLKLEEVREEVLNLLGHGMDAGGGGGEGGERAAAKGGKSKTPALDSFGRDPQPTWPDRTSSTRSSAARMRSNGSSRCCRVARKITPSSWARPGSARPRSSRGWRSSSSTATSPSCSETAGSSSSTSP